MIIPKKLPENDILRKLLSYDPITGKLIWKVSRGKAKINTNAGSVKPDGRVEISINGNTYKVHRVVWKMYYGVEPPRIIDHINGNMQDNAIANLREATPSENVANGKLPCHSSTGIKGLSWRADHNGYLAHIRVKSILRQKWFSIAVFGTQVAAFEAAKKWIASERKVLHGEFARFT